LSQETAKTEFWDAYWADFVKVQAELKNVGFDSDNSHFKTQYASLAAIRNAVIPAFNKHGFAVIQELETGEKGPRIRTLVAHKSGEFRQFGLIEFPAAKQDAQGWAGCITYLRRYSLCCLAGVTGDYDDDGETAVGRPETKTHKGAK
jgi:hypothetical protein